MKTTQDHIAPQDESKEPLPETLLPKQVCDILHIHINTFWKLANAGIIPARKVGGRWRVNRKALIDYINTTSAQTSIDAAPQGAPHA